MEARTERKRERATCIKPRSSGTGGGNSAGSRNSNGLCGFHVCTHKYIHTYTDELGVCVTRRNVSFSICVSGAAMVVFALYTTPRGKEGAKRGEDEGYRGSPNCDVGDAASVGITVRAIVARIQAGDSIKLDCGEANNQAVARPDRRVNPLSLSLSGSPRSHAIGKRGRNHFSRWRIRSFIYTLHAAARRQEPFSRGILMSVILPYPCSSDRSEIPSFILYVETSEKFLSLKFVNI